MRSWLFAHICLAATAAASGNCPQTCYSATCDYWDGGYWGTCSQLESVYGCSCGGCDCDGCPQGKCADASFDPAKCPKAGNGMCDRSDNHEGCNWDGHDCCASTCVGTLCGSRGYDCKNPNATEQAVSEKSAKTQQPTIQQQAGDTSVFNGQLTLKLQGGRADMDWNLVASATSDAMKITLGIDVSILSVKQVARRLPPFQSPFEAFERKVLIHFTARTSAIDASRLRAPINQMLDDAGLGVSVTSVSLNWCDGSACGTYGGTPEKSSPETDPLIIALAVSGAAFFLVFCAGAAILYKRMLRSSDKQAQAATLDHMANDEEKAVKDSTATTEKVDPEITSNSTMEPQSEVSDQFSDTGK